LIHTVKSISSIPLVILAGPTAIGKSTLAMKLAKKLYTDIISADSAQVYRDLNIGTAKPSVKEQKEIKHHLLDLINPDQQFSAADFQKAAGETIHNLWNSGKLPLMVGGTGLYIRAVTDCYAFGKKRSSAALRDSLNKEADLVGLDQIYIKLKEVDPDAALKIHPNDRRRIIRALEVYNLEGRPISKQAAETEPDTSPYDCYFYCLTMEREKLYKRIENRVDTMIEKGFLDEVKTLRQDGYSCDTPGMQILGYRQLCNYLQGNASWDETVSEIKKETRNLAKRQLTWFRRLKNIKWIEISGEKDFEKELNAALEIIYAEVKELIPSQANNTF